MSYPFKVYVWPWNLAPGLAQGGYEILYTGGDEGQIQEPSRPTQWRTLEEFIENLGFKGDKLVQLKDVAQTEGYPSIRPFANVHITSDDQGLQKSYPIPALIRQADWINSILWSWCEEQDRLSSVEDDSGNTPPNLAQQLSNPQAMHRCGDNAETAIETIRKIAAIMRNQAEAGLKEIKVGDNYYDRVELSEEMVKSLKACYPYSERGFSNEDAFGNPLGVSGAGVKYFQKESGKGLYTNGYGGVQAPGGPIQKVQIDAISVPIAEAQAAGLTNLEYDANAKMSIAKPPQEADDFAEEFVRWARTHDGQLGGEGWLDGPDQRDYKKYEDVELLALSRAIFVVFDYEEYNTIRDYINDAWIEFRKEIKEADAVEDTVVIVADRPHQGDEARDSVAFRNQKDPESAARARIMNGQFLLLQNFYNFALQNSITFLDPVPKKNKNGKYTSDTSRREQLKFVQNKKLINYLGAPESLVNLMNNPVSGLESFIDASNIELSVLVPTLKFFFVGENGERSSIDFPDHVHEGKIKGLASARSKASAENNILRRRGTHGTDVAMKSFTWDYSNKHEGEYIVEASLDLHFTSALELINDSYLGLFFCTGEPNFNSLKVGAAGLGSQMTEAEREAKAKEVIKARLKKLKDEDPPKESPGDLIVGEDARMASQAQMGANVSQLLVEMGWAVPDGNLPNNIREEFIESVRQTKRQLKLNFKGYNLNWGQNGQIDVSLEYVGSIDNALDHLVRADILRTKNHSKDFDMEEVVLDKIMKPASSLTTSEVALDRVHTYVENAWPAGYLFKRAAKNVKRTKTGLLAGAEIKDDFSVCKEGLDYEIRTLRMLQLETMRELDKMTPEQRAQKKKKKVPAENNLQLRGLMNSRSKAKNSKTIEVASAQELLEKYTHYLEVAKVALENVEEALREPRYAALLTKLLSEKKIYYAQFSPDAKGRIAQNKAKHLGQEALLTYNVSFSKSEKTSKKDPMESKSTRQARILNALKQATKNPNLNPMFILDPKQISPDTFDPGVGSRNIYFVRLADIIDAVLDNIVNPETLVDPKKRKNARKKANPDFVRVILGSFLPAKLGIPTFTEAQAACLGDIPISLEYFGQFYIQLITRGQVNSMSLRRFLDAMCLNLINPLFAEVAKRNKKSTAITNIGTLFSEVQAPLGSVINVGGSMGIKTLAKNRLQTSTEANKYLVLRCDMITYDSRNGDEIEDVKEGIYHLKVGADKGIVKTFNFSEMNLTSYYRTMQIEKSNRLDGVLIVPQNVELICVGNQFFPNGTLIYIDVDVGFGRVVARKLGLGGYYRIIRSVHNITASGYETTLSCVYQGSGRTAGM